MKAREWKVIVGEDDDILLDAGGTACWQMEHETPIDEIREHARNSRLAVLVEQELDHLRHEYQLTGQGRSGEVVVSEIELLERLLEQAAKEPTK